MITDLTQENLALVKNSHLRSYASIYTRIHDDFMAQIRQLGIEVDPVSYVEPVRESLAHLRRSGVVVRNDDKSAALGWLSPACEACRLGIGSATFFVSLQCHRDCFYCFNPNQEDFTHFTTHTRDLTQELQQIHASGVQMNHIALTGGEPLLHKQETIQFFETARAWFPAAYQRLYTCGDQLDEATLGALQRGRLDEIRFSIRMHDSAAARRHTLERMALAQRYVPYVMVEMPVLPGTLAPMQALLKELDAMGIAGINLLELCFPLRNAEEFRQRGFLLKNEPYRVIYNYWYAGGLPVSRSEMEALSLVEYAQAEGMHLGVHYCSLENKYSGQIYQQNTHGALPKTGYFSDRDFFIKSAKVFGSDVAKVERVFQKMGYRNYELHLEHNCLEFHVSKIQALRKLDIDVAISWNVLETRDDGEYVRELKLSLVHPKSFAMADDV